MGFQLREISVQSGGRHRLGPLSLELSESHLLGVVGPNGSGKTTLLRLLYGYLSPTEGKLTFDGRALDEIPPRTFAARVGACPQEAEPSLDFAVEQALALATEGDTEQAKRRSAELFFLGLDRLWGRRLSQLSGGEKQRVRLARAFFSRPDWLILDEPANHLDLATGWELMDFLRQRQAPGGVVVALHDLSFAVRFCHRLLVLKQGRVVAHDAPERALTPEVLKEVFGLSGRVTSQESTNRLEIDGVCAR